MINLYFHAVNHRKQVREYTVAVAEQPRFWCVQVLVLLPHVWKSHYCCFHQHFAKQLRRVQALPAADL